MLTFYSSLLIIKDINQRNQVTQVTKLEELNHVLEIGHVLLWDDNLTDDNASLCNLRDVYFLS